MAADSILIIAATQPRLAPLSGRASAIRSAIADYWALTKPEINLLIAIATSPAFIWLFQAQFVSFPGYAWFTPY